MANETIKMHERPTVFEGYLLKFTNLVKGYQYRWFIINNKSATLDYFEKEEHKHISKARGYISLIFADVCPLAEDSLTFIVNPKSGNYFKLKAQNTKDRQEWVNNIRSAISYFNNNLQNGKYYIEANGGLFRFRNGPECKSFHSTTSLNTPHSPDNNFIVNSNASVFYNEDSYNNSTVHSFREPNDSIFYCSEPFKNVSSLTAQMDDAYSMIVKSIDSLPSFACGSGLIAYDKNLLITKAICAATIDCLKNCVTLLRHRRFYHSRYVSRKYEMRLRNIPNSTISKSKDKTGSVNSLPTIGTDEKKVTDDDVDDPTIISAQSIDDLTKVVRLDISTNKYPSTHNLIAKFLLPIDGMEIETTNPIDLTQAIEDSNCYEEIHSEGDMVFIEENKTLLHHLLSQVKLGMDLTKVTLPTFILEARSLLEMFSDYMAHPNLFLKIADEKTPENRIKALLFWYITAFHAGKKDSLAKKPYNPIIGETFHCMWHVPVNQSSDGITKCHHVYFSAEQVSHHPPITAFSVQCPSKGMRLNASIHTKSKFQGMSIVAQMEGKVILHLDQYDEEYQFTLPNGHAKNILSVPKLELGDKVTITCSKTKYSSSLVFHNKVLFGHTSVNRIIGEIKDPDNKVLVKLSGDWSTTLVIEDLKSCKVTPVNVADLLVFKKYVNPENKLKAHESRRLWHFVTESLINNDMEKATKFKKELESRQRQSENVRNSKKLQFPVKYFQSTLDGRWVFRNDMSHVTKKCF